MLLNIILFIFLQHLCYGRDIPFFDETPLCAEGLLERREMPLYEFDKPPIPLDQMLDIVFSPDKPFLRSFSGANDQDVPYISTTQLRLKKRSLTTESEDNTMKDDNAPYEVRFLTPLMRETRDKEDIKTIHLPPSFTPRLGRKRSQEIDRGDSIENDNINIDDQSQGAKETPTIGRSEKKNKINLFAGSAFTPRLGRSGESPKIRFQPGSPFSSHLGRSEDSPRIRFQAGSVFTPRLGRSSHSGKVIFNAKAAFNPRQQRANRIHLNAGSAFTPRLGRSDDSNVILNAGSSFTPRLGRSEDKSRIQLNAGSAFTPRLG